MPYMSARVNRFFKFINREGVMQMQQRKVIAALAVGSLGLLAGTQTMAAEQQEELLEKVKDHISIHGAIEVEAGWSEDFEGASESDITLSTAEIGFEAKLNDWATGTLNLEWVDEDDKIDVDEAFIRLGNTEKFPVSVQAGRFVVPFGVFAGSTIADPLTMQAFETKEDAVMAEIEYEGLHAGAYVFNGDTNEGGGNDTIEHFGAHIGYTLKNDTFEFNTHLGYLSSVIDADGLSENLDLTADYVDGLAAQASVKIAGITLIGEYITAIDDYQPAYAASSKPRAFYTEANYCLELGMPLLFALVYSGTEDLAGFFPEARLAAIAGVELTEGLGLKLEYSHDTDYDIADGGTGEEADAVTVQLAYEF
jgi:hypothetical protein